jgi:hypothetical protein
MQGGFFLRKKPLSGSGFGIQQLWNRCKAGYPRFEEAFAGLGVARFGLNSWVWGA